MSTQEIQLQNYQLFDGNTSFPDGKRLFYGYFKIIPSVMFLDEISVQKFRNKIDTEWKERITIQHRNEFYSKLKKKLVVDDVFYMIDEKLFLKFDRSYTCIYYQEKDEAVARELINIALSFKVRQKLTQEISLVISTISGLDTVDIKIKKPALELNTHYNDDLLPIHKKCISLLKEKDKSGLYLFHGIPGTGKSTYIRYLIRSIYKRVIFMPPGLAGNLDSPSLVKFLVENQQTVFVIEDAEELLVSRELNKNSSISMLLNLTDGLLGETLGIQIIATFNTDLLNIDKALLRKGRLLALYDFKALSTNKSKTLLEKRGILNQQVYHPMTLAEIYNQEEDAFEFKTTRQRASIGFLANAG
jgi:hypothetical protein